MTPSFVLASLPHLGRFDAAQPPALGRARLDERIATLPDAIRAMIAFVRHQLAPWREPSAPAVALPAPIEALLDEQQRWNAMMVALRAMARHGHPLPPARALPAAMTSAMISAMAERDAIGVERLRLAHLWQAADRHGLGHPLDRVGLLIAVVRWDAAIGWAAADSVAAAARIHEAAIDRIGPHG